MTTESLCYTEQDHQQEQEQEKQQIEEAEADRTTELEVLEFDSTIDRPNQGQGLRNEDREKKIGAVSRDETVLLSRISLSSKTGQKRHRIATNWDIEEANRELQACNGNRDSNSRLFIDSRSILNNKQKLKRFWERRMEMDFETRQSQQQQQQQLLQVSQQPQVDEVTVAAKKIADFNDVNNNNIDDGDDGNRNDQFRAIEWQSLSPNVELVRTQKSDDKPTGNEGKPKEEEGEKGKHVPSESETLLRSAAKTTTSSSAVLLNPNQNQLMSIDPTLCHHQTAAATASKQQPPVANPKATEQHQSIENSIENECEEQFANEEFSSSNSSFGPMSISQQQQQNQSHNQQGQQNGFISQQSDEELNSTQSGSVLTVITNNKEEKEDETEDIGEIASQEDEEQQDSTERQVNSIEVDENDGDDEEEEESGSNIGVAFESLQFDTEIKSSKHERVEDNLLMVSEPLRSSQHSSTLCNGQPQQSPSSVMRQQLELEQQHQEQPATLMPKFNVGQVKSVCSFISAAISDATKQVEKITNPQNRQTLADSLEKEQQQQQQQQRQSQPQKTDEPADQLKQQRVAASSLPKMSQHRATFMVQQEDQQVSLDPMVAKEATLATTSPRSVYVEAQEQLIEDLDEVEGSSDAMEHAEVQKASALSSIFEANVRREIERFESNSMVRRMPRGLRNSLSESGNSNHQDQMMVNGNAALTEWKIAEEIRLFNERELELKRRLKSSNSAASKSISAQSNVDLQTHEAIVRNGKTFQIPKAKGLNMLMLLSPMQQQLQQQQQYLPTTLPSPLAQKQDKAASTVMKVANPEHNLTKSIKLTTSVSGNGTSEASTQNQPQQQQQAATMISMHKFISSGGKRYVYQTSSGGSQLNSSTLSLHNSAAIAPGASNCHQFTKSMSNLSTIGKGSNNNNHNEITRRDADYKAIDSLKCKETPNVEPGTTKKVIETLSRNFKKNVAGIPNNPTYSSSSSIHGKFTVSKHFGGADIKHVAPIVKSSNNDSNVALTAEMKIQEELRDMRAREAELRDQQRRRNSVSSSQEQVTSKIIPNYRSKVGQSTNIHATGLEGESNIDTDDYEADVERICALDKQKLNHNNDNNNNINDSNNMKNDTHHYEMEEGCNHHMQVGGDNNDMGYTSDSLYPIKQAIDTFRRLNTASNQQQDFRPQKFSKHQLANENGQSHSTSASVMKIQQKFLS